MRQALGLNVDVVKHLEVVRDEADWARNNVGEASFLLGAKNIENVWTNPRVGGATGRLPGEVPVAQSSLFRGQGAENNTSVVARRSSGIVASAAFTRSAMISMNWGLSHHE